MEFLYTCTYKAADVVKFAENRIKIQAYCKVMPIESLFK